MITLMVIGFFVTKTGHYLLAFFDTSPKVIAFCKIDAAQPDVDAVVSAMQSKPYVSQVKLTNKEQAYQIYKDTTKDHPDLLTAVTPDILPESIEIQGKGSNSEMQIRTDLQGFSVVDTVSVQPTLGEQIQGVFSSLIKKL